MVSRLLMVAYFALRSELTPSTPRDQIMSSCPSTVSKDRRIVLQTPNLGGFNNTPVAALIENRFQVPVLVEKDVVFLQAHDMVALGLSQDGTTIGIYFGTGIGNAIHISGSFFHGTVSPGKRAISRLCSFSPTFFAASSVL